jgi:hypothetical protein
VKGWPVRRPGPAILVAPSRLVDEQGFVGGFEGLLFGFLIFLVGTLIVAHAWAVVDTKFAVVEAAKQAARTYVEAPSGAGPGPRPSKPPTRRWPAMDATPNGRRSVWRRATSVVASASPSRFRTRRRSWSFRW